MALINPGSLSIRLKCHAGVIETVDIQSSRPLHVNRVFIGKTPEQLLTLIPLLFNVCGIAQSFAAITALQQAQGFVQDPKLNAARQLLLTVELLREHCWWLLMPHDKPLLAPFMQLVDRFKQALFVDASPFSANSRLQVDNQRLNSLINSVDAILEEVIGEHGELIALTANEQLLEWINKRETKAGKLVNQIIGNNWQSLGSCNSAFLPTLDTYELESRLKTQQAKSFIMQPTWEDKARETGCLNRQQHHALINSLLSEYGNGLLTRVMSRLLEIASIPVYLKQHLETMNHSCHYDADTQTEHNTGIARIESARGLLIHRVVLHNGVVNDFQIVAPTEWNFHPQGVVSQSLEKLKAHHRNTLIQQATLLVNAIDPCVSYQLIIT
jgi:Ni,Fe-hydrogenase I large subunit